MKCKKIKNKNDTILINLRESGFDFPDIRKFSSFSEQLNRGLKNYLLFQRFSNYRWPYWICCSKSIKSNFFNPNLPFQLINNSDRNWISFSNIISNNRVLIDPAGMVSPTYDCWSLEVWVYIKGKLLRPQECGMISQTRDYKTLMTKNIWKEKDFELTERIYGLKSNIEEAIIELDCQLDNKAGFAALIAAIRPYNIESIGGLNSIEYRKETGVLRINKYDRIAVKSADFVSIGNGKTGDLDIDDTSVDSIKVKCNYGMASLALGYRLKTGRNEYRIRVSLSENKAIIPGEIDFAQSKSDYIEYTGLKSARGFKLSFPDTQFKNWFYGSKITSLNYYKKDIVNIPGIHSGMKAVFYITTAYNRMGYTEESLEIINSSVKSLYIGKKPAFMELINGCYILCSVIDYFMITRDIDYLKSNYSFISEIAVKLYRESIQINKKKKAFMDKLNSIENYIALEHNIYDLLLLSFSLQQFAYSARCLGIFGDEIKFNKESDRLEKIIIDDMNSSCNEIPDDSEKAEEGIKDLKDDIRHKSGSMNRGIVAESNDFFSYNIFSGFPFRVKSMGIDKLELIIQRIFEYFVDVPLLYKSTGGADTLLSIVLSNNMLITKDPRAHDFFIKMVQFAKGRYVIPDIINPQNGLCVIGEGDSPVAISAFFTYLRSMLFIDTTDRLDIFPVPRKEWFYPDTEIKIEDAPSVFGPINFNVVSKKNEVLFHFNNVPKFIPPDIRINLPFNARIKEEDDFIVKKECANSFIINGWPSVVRLVRMK